MLGQVPSRTRQNKRNLTKASTIDAIDVDMQHELNSLEELASSRPIALSELWSRASLRGKATRSLKSVQHLSVRSEDAKDISNDATSAVASPSKTRPRFTSLPQPCNDEGHNKSHQGASLKRPQIQSELYTATQTVEAEGLGWYAHSDNLIHENPLSYTTGVDPSRAQYPGHGHHEGSEIPFFKSRVFLRMEHASWPGDTCSSYNPHADCYSQGLGSDDLHMAGAYIELPHSSIDTEANRLSYDTSTTQGYHYNNEDIHSTLFALNHNYSEQLQQGYQVQEPEQTETEYSEVVHEKLPSKFSKSAQARISSSKEIQYSNPIRFSNASHLRKLSAAESNSSKDSAKRSIKEEASAYLQSVVEDAQQASQNSMVQSSTSVLGRRSEIDHSANCLGSFPAILTTKQKKVGETRSGSEQSFPLNEPFTLFHGSSSLGQTPIQHNDPNGNESNETREVIHGPYGGIESVAGRITRPPPGLCMPSMPGTTTESSYPDNPFVPKSARLEAVNTWFHTDNRGQEQLRQYVAAIAQDHAERTALFHDGSTSVPEATTVMQTTLLLGNAIANLQTYVSRNHMEQAEYFATYGEAQPHCYESSPDGHPSFFDRDPLFNQWRLPTTRGSHCVSRKYEKELISIRFHEARAINQTSNGW
ncbi:uncharacterized protein ACLA_092320 [Aspergillus clavatus NRRL 1]|uniref:Uncharacterized protein n=1 Tax=Aspergillus clavatus (strain ATCC 1007 / CBS 513.65 / DSM 816 / NCTC 3887 / NRRL 1 / QM 1276 / 107) TaxID=344612 RepID=A1CF85_ASPCL|nr:uncharacterized protein ACLA_092320 [Aspergillus clavatus NRRL 1]EAW11534.1 conserved hypothetical protein [Aspergillus clavatus NRRL 1]